MKYLIYVSSATKLMDEAELAAILSKSRENNTKRNLTGILLYSQGTFMQVLEGEEKLVDDTFNKIKYDRDHKGIIVLTSGELTERNFPDWSMAFRSINADEMAELQGYMNPNDPEAANSTLNGAHPTLRVIKTFLQVNPF